MLLLFEILHRNLDLFECIGDNFSITYYNILNGKNEKVLENQFLYQ